MKRLTLAVLLVTLLIATRANAGEKYVIGAEILAVTSSTVASGLASIPATATECVISISGDSIRWKMYIDPTHANGMILDEGDYLILDTHDQIKRFKAIILTAAGGASGYSSIDATYLAVP